MKITFLGTNGWYATKAGNTICTLLESEKYYIIFDAGDGIYKLDKYIKKDKPIYLFLSHLHLDHIFGFHILSKFKFKKPITIFVENSRKKYLENVIKSPYTLSFENMKVKIVGVKEGEYEKPFNFSIKKLLHTDMSIGFRMNLDGKSVCHCLDTGISENVIALSKDADVLIHECSAKTGVFSGGWGHTNPEETAEAAKKSGVKKLVLTHFSANQYVSLKDRRLAQKIAQRIFKNTIAASDGMVIKI